MNPFTLKPYAGPKWFCDREKETNELISSIKSKRNVTLHSIRRLGKTGLIMHAQSKLSKSYLPVYLDVLDTLDVYDFVNKLITAVIAAHESRKSAIQKTLQLFARFRATLVVDPTIGVPSISLDIKEKQDVRLSLQVLWNIIKEEKKWTFQIAIDEFQKITEYPHHTIDASIREASQTIPNLHFIFSGSQRHLLTSLFSDVSKPLFKSSQLMELSPINPIDYSKFIRSHFQNYNKKIKKDIIHSILQWTKNHTYYVQYFCHLLFEKSGSEIIESDIQKIKRHIYTENESNFYQFKKLVTKTQWQLLSAIAHENILYHPTSTAFRNRYNLGAASTIARTLESLLNKEMLYSKFDKDGMEYYQVYDVFLARWIVHKGI